MSYQPADSESGLFGGNSNWRGPIWFPVNYLLVNALYRFADFYGQELKVECPTGSSRMLHLDQVDEELTHRLTAIFRRNEQGDHPIYGGADELSSGPHFRDHILFYEYFHGDSGRGLGASHQTGWTGAVGKLLQPRQSRSR